MRDYHGCSICGRKFPEDALTLFCGDYFCEHCLDEENRCLLGLWGSGFGMTPQCRFADASALPVDVL